MTSKFIRSLAVFWPRFVLLTLSVLLVAAVAHAASAPPDPGADPGGFFVWLYTAFTSKDWAVLVAGLVFGGVFLVRKLPFGFLKGKLAGYALAFVPTCALAFIGAVGAGKSVLYALAGAAMSSALAAMGWEAAKDVKAAAAGGDVLK